MGAPDAGAAAAAGAATAEAGKEDDCPLAAIFYADFDNVRGRKIRYQYPPEKFTHDHYKMLSAKIICDNEFCEKVNVIDSMAIPWTLASYPSSISDEKKYDRIVLRYNVSFVFKKGHARGPKLPYDKDPFVKVLERFGWWLREMELRFGYLYGGGGEANKVRLRECLGRVYKGLKTERRAWLMMRGPGCPSMMPLMQPYLAATPRKNWRKIQDHDVPVRRCPGLVESVSAAARSALVADPDAVWSAEVDMVVQQVVPHINGVKHVKKISRDSQVEIAAVKGALQWVLYTNQILLTDVFRYGNIYVQTARTADYTRRSDFAKACWERIAKPISPCLADEDSGGDNQNDNDHDHDHDSVSAGGDDEDSRRYSDTVGEQDNLGARRDVRGDWGQGINPETGTIPDAPHPMSLIKLYASFQSDRCVMDVLRMAEGPAGFVEQFDHRRMCSFGVEVGILRRLHSVPLCVRLEGREAAARREAIKHANFPRRSLGGRFGLEYVQRLLNGRRTEDALCCFLSCSPQELAEFATSDGSKIHRLHPF